MLCGWHVFRRSSDTSAQVLNRIAGVAGIILPVPEEECVRADTNGPMHERSVGPGSVGCAFETSAMASRLGLPKDRAVGRRVPGQQEFRRRNFEIGTNI